MKRSIYFFLFGLWMFSPFFVKADHYPINKNIDVIHYAFNLSLSDSTNEILGSTLVTVKFKEAGMQNLRLDFVNKTDLRQAKIGRAHV